MADTEKPVASSPAAVASLSGTIDHGATGDKMAPKPSTSKKRAAVAKPRKTQTGDHPKYSVMIADAISKLKERGGSSRQAILKYITSNYKVGSEMNKVNARVKLALKSGIKTGSLKQSKGTGAAGSFRLGDTPKKTSKKTQISTAKRASGTKAKTKAAARKPKSPAKKTAPKKARAKSPAKKAKTVTRGKTSVKKAKGAASKTKSQIRKNVKQKKPAKKTAGKK